MILVTTPTGNTGKLIVEQLVELNYPVRVLVRDPQKLTEEVHNRVEIIQGSLLDTATLTQAMEGCDSVFYCIPQSVDPADVIQYYDDFAQTALTAIKQAGPRQVVYLGGVGKASGIKTAGTASALFHAEDVLATSGAALRTLRCPVFFDNLFWQIPAIYYSGGWGLPIAGEYKLPQVAVKDIATTAVALLTDPTWQGVEGVGVLGPHDLSHNEIAEALSAMLGKPIRFRTTSRAEHLSILTREGLSEALALGVADMFEAIANGLFETERNSPQTTTPTTIQQWLGEDFLPAFNQFGKFA